MRKILVIAWSDFRQTVFTKTFLISVVLMPMVIFGILAMEMFSANNVDLKDRRIAIIDGTGQLYGNIVKEAEKRNRGGRVFRGSRGGKEQVAPKYLPERSPHEGRTISEIEVALSERVRHGELSAFVIIGRDVIVPGGGRDHRVAYYSEAPTEGNLPDWLTRVINQRVASIRFEEAGINQRLINKINRRVGFDRLGLAEVSETGAVARPKRENLLQAMAIPFGAAMLLFITVNLSAPLMLNTVMEEKMQKIAEILISSVPPFHLMLGKLLAATLVALAFSTVYIGSLLLLLMLAGKVTVVPLSLYLWFFVFLIFALLSFGSMWAGIGAACADIKDTQNFASVAVLMIVVPFVLTIPVMQSPSSAFSIGVSLVPPFTPLLMMVRLAIPPGPEPWEVATGLALCFGFSLLCVWAAGRVFRIGFLAQGQSPTLGQLARWIFSR